MKLFAGITVIATLIANPALQSWYNNISAKHFYFHRLPWKFINKILSNFSDSTGVKNPSWTRIFRSL
jgi:hypothetical protein